MREYILYPICESLGLTPRTTLELLNSYFCEHPEKYYWIYTLESKIKGLEDQINQTYQQLQQRQNQQQMMYQGYNPQNQVQMIQQDPMYVNLKKSHEQFKQELCKAAEDTNIYVQEFYMAERSQVL